MTLPSIYQIRESLADVEGALVGEPSTSKVDVGDVSCVPISLPRDNAEEMKPSLGLDSMESTEASADDEPRIIFEIPPDLDDRTIKEQLGRNRGSRFEQLIEVNGTDALGWYFPFHYQIAQHGIYISSRGAVELAIYAFRRKYSDDPREDLSRRLQYAVHAILRHEAFHFVTECMAANWELALGSACYVKARERLRGPGGYIEQEEALANAYMIRGFRWKSSATFGAQATPLIKAFCVRQPAGYNCGPHYVATTKFLAGCRELAFQYHGCGKLCPFFLAAISRRSLIAGVHRMVNLSVFPANRPCGLRPPPDARFRPLFVRILLPPTWTINAHFDTIANQRKASAMNTVIATTITADSDAALNENQAAEFLGLSVRTLQAWRVRGSGPRYCKIGRSVRYQRRELVTFQREHTVSSTSDADVRTAARGLIASDNKDAL